MICSRVEWLNLVKCCASRWFWCINIYMKKRMNKMSCAYDSVVFSVPDCVTSMTKYYVLFCFYSVPVYLWFGLWLAYQHQNWIIIIVIHKRYTTVCAISENMHQLFRWIVNLKFRRRKICFVLLVTFCAFNDVCFNDKKLLTYK